MSNIGISVLKIALIDAVERQQLITAELEQMPEQSNVRKLVAEQTHLLEETLSLLNRIA
jgi:acetate kinase